MSTTIPESVTTSTTTTTITTDPTIAHSTTVPSHEPADALASSVEPTLTEKAKAAAVSAGTTISAAAQTAGTAIANAAHTAGTAISNAAHDFDSRHHVSDKASDVAAHVGAALKHGNPIHAAKHAGTAATIGDAERAKHEQGPLSDNAHAADTVASASSSSTATTTTTSSSSGPSLSDQASAAATKIGNQASDAASFAGAAISAGNPVHAAKYASAAATIGEVEREKHAHGPLDNEAEIAKVTHH